MSMSIQNLYASENSRKVEQPKPDDDKNVQDANLPSTSTGIRQAVQQSVNMQILQASAQVSILAGEQS